jgi:hypothetical protein
MKITILDWYHWLMFKWGLEAESVNSWKGSALIDCRGFWGCQKKRGKWRTLIAFVILFALVMNKQMTECERDILKLNLNFLFQCEICKKKIKFYDAPCCTFCHFVVVALTFHCSHSRQLFVVAVIKFYDLHSIFYNNIMRCEADESETRSNWFCGASIGSWTHSHILDQTDESEVAVESNINHAAKLNPKDRCLIDTPDRVNVRTDPN